jgi:hypothetical protein
MFCGSVSMTQTKKRSIGWKQVYGTETAGMIKGSPICYFTG